MAKVALVRAPVKRPEGPPWPNRVSARERLERNLSQPEVGARDPSEDNHLWLNARFGHALREIAGAGDLEGLGYFYQFPGMARILARSDFDWIGSICEKGSPEAIDMMIRQWVAPFARPEIAANHDQTVRGALRCVKAALTRAEDREGTLAAARELSALYRDKIALARPAAWPLSEALRQVAPKMTLGNFETAARWALQDERGVFGDGPAIQMAHGLSDYSSGRRGERDKEGLERCAKWQSALLRLMVERYPACDDEWSPMDAWEALSLFVRESSLAKELSEAEGAWSPAEGFAIRATSEARAGADGEALLFPGQRRGGAKDWLGRRLSLVSVAMLQGNREMARDLKAHGSYWSEREHFELISAIESSTLSPYAASPSETRALERARAWGEELALELSAESLKGEEPGARPRAPGRSI